MSQSKKKALPQFAELSAQSEHHEGSMEMTQNAIDATSKKKEYIHDDENLETSNLVAKKSSFNSQLFCLIVVIGILAIAVVVFASIAISCMVTKSQGQNINSNESPTSKLSIDNGTQISNQTKMVTENTKQKDQISTLNIKLADLEFEVKKLQIQLEQEQKKPKEIHNESYVVPTNQTTTNPQPPVPSNSTQINKPSNQTQVQNQTQPSNKTIEQKPVDPQKPKEQQKPKFTVRSSQRNGIPPSGGSIDRYEFNISIDDIVAKSPISQAFPSPDSQWSGIKKPEFQRAIRLMQVVHNVNFKGEFVLDHYNFYTTPEDKYKALSKIVNEEKEFYDQKYEINKYIKDQIGICVFVPSFNNAKNRLYLRNLDSIFQQDYQNYHVVYVNDASTDGTGDYVKSYMEENEIPTEKYVIINNQKNIRHCANIYMAAHEQCNPGEIMILLDGDDALIGRQVFSLLNAVYQKQKVALTYGQFLLVRNDQISNGFSRQIPYQNLEKGTFRQLRGFFTSHLKTMYVDVMREIKVTDLQYANGTYYDYAPDVAYMTPAIELVGTRLKFLKELIYEYRFDTGSNEPHQKQIIVQYQVYDKPASKKMESLPFADNPKTVHYP